MLARLYACLSALGCAASPPVPLPPGSVADAGVSLFADTVISFGAGGQIVTCTDSLPACGAAAQTCGAAATLGPNDGISFDLGPAGRLEVAFRCSVIRERGPAADGSATDEIRIWASLAAGAEAVVEVSFDGSSYTALGVLDATHQSFDLARIPADAVRFVRIADRGAGGIAIDAVEGLQ